MTHQIRINFSWASIFLFLFLASCSMEPDSFLVPVGAVSFGDEMDVSEPPYGLMLLARGDPNNQTLCEGFFSFMQTVGYEEAISNPNLVPTFWPLKARSDIKEEDFQVLIATDLKPETEEEIKEFCTVASRGDVYDFRRAQEFLFQLGDENIENFAGSPILVAKGLNPDQILILDLSFFRAEDLKRAINMWQVEIVQDPSAWEDAGWRIAILKEKVRTAFITYSPNIVAAIRVYFGGDDD